MSDVADAGIVGGGLAGLAAALSLMEAGARVTVYEARADVGGRMRSDLLDDAVVDPGVQLVSSTYSAFFRLARECGAGDLLVRAPGRDALWREGRAHAITYGSIGSMVGSGALPTGLKLKLGTRYLPFLAKRARTLDANDLLGSGGLAFDDESAAVWGRRELGDDFVELLAYPLLAAYYGGAPEHVSAALYHALARVGMDVRVSAVQGGAGAMPRAMADRLSAQRAVVRTGTQVQRVRAEGNQVRVELDSDAATHDAVVLATPAAVAARLLDASGALGEWLGGVRSTPATTAAFLLDAPLDRDWFGLSFPRGSIPGEWVAALAAQSRKLPSLVPGGREVVVAYPAPAAAPRLASAEPEGVVDALLPSLEHAFPGFGERTRQARVYHFPEGYTLFYPGYLRHLSAFEDGWLTPTVALAGDYLVAPSVEGAVRSGMHAAQRLLGARAAG